MGDGPRQPATRAPHLQVVQQPFGIEVRTRYILSSGVRAKGLYVKVPLRAPCVEGPKP